MSSPLAPYGGSRRYLREPRMYLSVGQAIDVQLRSGLWDRAKVTYVRADGTTAEARATESGETVFLDMLDSYVYERIAPAGTSLAQYPPTLPPGPHKPTNNHTSGHQIAAAALEP